MPSNENLIKQIDKLKSPLATSSLSQTNQPLFQVITQLIDVLRGAIGNIESVIGDSGGGGGGLADQHYITWVNDLAQLPLSRVAVAGTDIELDLSVAGQVTINFTGTSGGGSEWSVLTNGDPINPELIFAGGDVIMVHTP
jgi:hypothetical protein